MMMKPCGMVAAGAPVAPVPGAAAPARAFDAAGSAGPAGSAAVPAKARVDGVRVPGLAGANSVVPCAGKDFFSESRSFRWHFAVGGRSARPVAVHFRHASNAVPGAAGPADRMPGETCQSP